MNTQAITLQNLEHLKVQIDCVNFIFKPEIFHAYSSEILVGNSKKATELTKKTDELQNSINEFYLKIRELSAIVSSKA